mmetsp:Transcript_64106/g.206500  ORF Transcript_64106/g.206500 Transcript_64106/m.206500 type:complete len:200 (+) Transcript_64106:1244-1843(+)
MAVAVASAAAVARRRRCADLRASFSCRCQARSSSERCPAAVPPSFEGQWWLVKTVSSRETVLLQHSCSGSSTATLSRKACGRRCAKSSTASTSASVRRSSGGRPEPSYWPSTCSRTFWGARAWRRSCVVGLTPSLAPSARKGLQAAQAPLSKACSRTPSRRLTCFAALGVLFSTTMGFESFMPWIIVFFIGTSLPPMKT